MHNFRNCKFLENCKSYMHATSILQAPGRRPSLICNLSLQALIAAIALSLGLSGCGGISVHGATSSTSTVATLSVTPASVDFGSVDIGSSVYQSVAISNSSSSPVQISQLSISDPSFSIEGAGSLPLNVASASTVNLLLKYSPTAETDSSASLSISTNATADQVTQVKLHGKGIKQGAAVITTLSAFSCQSASMTGAGSDTCTIALSGSAPTGGLSIALSGSSSAVTLPASVVVPAGASSATFSATVSAVTSVQSVTLTASANSTTKTFALQLNAYVPTLSVSTSSLSFGNVSLNAAATNSVTLSSTGTAPVTISAATVSGTGFSVSGATFPTTLNAGQSIVLAVQFNPTAAGAVTGQLGITSNSYTNPTTTVSLSGTGMSVAPSLNALSCQNASMTGAGSDTCTVTLSGAAPTGGMSVSLASGSSAVVVPASVTVAAAATSATFSATISAVTSAQSVTLTASANSTTKTFALQLNAYVPTLSVSTGSLSFGNVSLNTSATNSVTLSSTGTAPVTINAATVTGTGFSVSGATFPATLNAGQSLVLTVQFNPTTAGSVTGQLSITSTSSTNPTATISLSGTGTTVTPSLSSLYCQNASMTGAGSDACTVTLSGSAPTGGMSVALSDSSSAVTLPASVVVPAGASSATFSATVSAVTSAQSVTLTASANSTTKTFALQLNAYVPTLSVSASSLSFGNVSLNTTVTKSVTLNSTGTAPVTINAAAVTGTGFAVSGATFPATLNAGQSLVLTVQFNPTAAGSVTGQLSITSNSSANPTASVSLSGTGTSVAPTVSAVYCNNSSMTGAGTDACTVTLSGSAPTGGSSVSLSSNNSAVVVPASVTVPAAATSVAFSATVTAVSTAQSVTITAATGGTSMGFSLQLNAAVPTLSINATSIAFGSVIVNSATTQTITLTSTGTAAVTVSAATVSGTGFSITSGTTPVTLNPGQSANITLQFVPTTVGSASGQLTITSNSSANPTAVIALSGTGAPHHVDLSWSAPSSSSNPISGYNVYRAPSGTTSFQVVNSSLDAQTAYSDSTVQSGKAYTYYVTSVDSTSAESAPSNTTTVSIP